MNDEDIMRSKKSSGAKKELEIQGFFLATSEMI